MKIRVVFEPMEEGGFSAYVPTLPGCVAEGDTLDDAQSSIRVAIESCLIVEDDVWIPEEPGVIVRDIVF